MAGEDRVSHTLEQAIAYWFSRAERSVEPMKSICREHAEQLLRLRDNQAGRAGKP